MKLIRFNLEITEEGDDSIVGMISSKSSNSYSYRAKGEGEGCGGEISRGEEFLDPFFFTTS